MRCRPGVFFSSQKHFAVFGQLMGQPEKLDPKRRKSGSASSTRLVGSSSKKTFKVDSSHWSSTSADATTTRLNGERSMRLDVPSDKSSRGVGSNLEVGSKLLLLLPTLLLLLGRTSSGRNPIPGGLEKIPSSEQGNKKHTHTKKEESYCFVTEHTVQRGRPTGRKHLTLTTLIILHTFTTL